MAAVKSSEEKIYEAIVAGEKTDKIKSLLTEESNIDYQSQQTGKSLLHEAVALNQSQTTQMLISHGANVNIRTLIRKWDDDRMVPLHLATMTHIGFDIFEVLVNSDADVNTQDSDGRTALHYVVSQLKNISSQIKKLDLLLQNGADINMGTFQNYTPLHGLGVSFNIDDKDNFLKVLDKLLSNGANVNAQDYLGETNLFSACKDPNFGMMDKLLHAGANPCICSTDGKTPLHILAMYNKNFPNEGNNSFLGYAKRLVKAGLDINMQSVIGETALHLLCNFSESVDMLDGLLSLGADVNIKDSYGRTPLHDCTSDRKGSTDLKMKLVQTVLRHGATINTRNINGATCLHEAADSCNLNSVVVLLEAECQVNSADKCGRTPLHRFVLSADKNSNLTILVHLIHNGADISATDKFHKTAFDYLQFKDEALQRKIRDLAISVCLKSLNHSDSIHPIKLNFLEFKLSQLRNYLNISSWNKTDWHETTGFPWKDKISFVRELMYTPGIGTVNTVADFNPVFVQVDTLMERISHGLNCHGLFLDMGLQFQPKLSGGVSEGSKIGMPDEFDYLFLMRGWENVFEMVENDAVPGYVALHLIKETHLSKYRTIMFPRDNRLFDSSRFWQLFYYVIYQVMSDSDIWTDLDLIWFNKGSDLFSYRANIYIDLRMTLPDFGDFRLSIDVVPAVEVAGWWPQTVTRYKPIINNCTENYCILLGKFVDQRKRPQDFVTHLRISTSQLETDIINCLPEMLHRGFLLTKIMTSLCTAPPFGISVSSRYLNTYLLKTTLMHVAMIHYNNETQSVQMPHFQQEAQLIYSRTQEKMHSALGDCGERSKEVSIAYWATYILKTLETSGMTGVLSSFFVPDLNLLENNHGFKQQNKGPFICGHFVRKLNMQKNEQLDS